jgi:hypothetical protein
MHDTSGFANFFNDISLTGLEGLAELNLEDISAKLNLLEGIFEEYIKKLKQQSIGNITRTHLLGSNNDAEFVAKAITDESSSKTQTEYINHRIAKLILCQNSIIRLVTYLRRKIQDYKFYWKIYKEKGQSDTIDMKHQFRTLLKTYFIIDGLCQNIGLAISDYFRLYGQIRSSISTKEKDFIIPKIADPEITVSERLNQLYIETENCLFANPPESILGFSAVRIGLESYITIKIQDKMRQNIRIKDGNNYRDMKFTSKLRTNDIFEAIKDLFPDQKEYDALNMIYGMSSRTVHRAIPVANYLSWGSLMFVLNTLQGKLDSLNPEDAKLESVIAKLKNEGKLVVITSKWYL